MNMNKVHFLYHLFLFFPFLRVSYPARGSFWTHCRNRVLSLRLQGKQECTFIILSIVVKFKQYYDDIMHKYFQTLLNIYVIWINQEIIYNYSYKSWYLEYREWTKNPIQGEILLITFDLCVYLLADNDNYNNNYKISYWQTKKSNHWYSAMVVLKVSKINA